MRRRQQFPTPPAEVNNPDSRRAAEAIAGAINQGLPGGQFARLMNVMDGRAVKAAAALTVPELIAWFQQDAEAAAILKACPTFDEFAAAFHAQAIKMYPPGTP